MKVINTNKTELKLIEIINQIFEETNKEQTRVNYINNDHLNFDGIINVECACLFTDFGGSTILVDKYDHKFSSWLLKSYLKCASTVIRQSGGVISAFEGDGLMVLFMGDSKESDAVRCAFKIQWTVVNIIQPMIDRLFPEKKYRMEQVVGIDSSELSAIKTQVWDHYDILWVGRSANYSAFLTQYNHDNYSTYITSDVYSKLPKELLTSNSVNSWNLMEERINEIELYRSSKMVPLSEA